MKEAFLEGFVSGSGVVLCLLVTILAYFVVKGLMRGPRQSSITDPTEKAHPNRSKRLVKSAKSCCILVGGAFFVLALLYLYLTGSYHYDGIVSDKVTETIRDGQPHTLYFVTIKDAHYQVDESLYSALSAGDRLRKPMLRPWVYINDRKVFLEDIFRSSGFWLGFVGNACAVMCLWSLASAFRATHRRFFR